jgi:hypothetical protein
MALIEAVETNLPRVINLESGYNKGTIRAGIRYLVVSKDVAQLLPG